MPNLSPDIKITIINIAWELTKMSQGSLHMQDKRGVNDNESVDMIKTFKTHYQALCEALE